MWMHCLISFFRLQHNRENEMYVAIKLCRCRLLCAMRYLMCQPAMSDTANHASTRRQARTDGGGGGGEKESSVPE